MNISINELEKGDLIFFMDATNNSLRTESYVESVVLVTEVDDKEGRCQVACADNKIGKIIALDLSELVHESYTVYRCKNSALASAAASLAQQWARLDIPYSKERKKIMENLESEYKTSAEVLAASKKSYAEHHNFFRVVKVAARRAENPSNKGYRPDQFVTLCYQVAELGDKVPEQDSVGYCHITDKYAAEKHLKKHTVERLPGYEAYMAYKKSLFKVEKTVEKKSLYYSSFHIWHDGEDNEAPASYFLSAERCLPLDSKISSPSALMCLVSQSAAWQHVGTLTLSPPLAISQSCNRLQC